MTRRALFLLLALTACDDGSDDPSPAADAAPASAYPPECAARPDLDAARCADRPDRPHAVLCQGAPPAIILEDHCKYLNTSVGAGNVYCCP
jgi:hypothetical protein